MQMSDEDIKLLIDYFGDSLPDPTHNPIQFGYYVKLFLKLKEWKVIPNG